MLDVGAGVTRIEVELILFCWRFDRRLGSSISSACLLFFLRIVGVTRWRFFNGVEHENVSFPMIVCGLLLL
jgi:hypothetical protein